MPPRTSASENRGAHARSSHIGARFVAITQIVVALTVAGCGLAATEPRAAAEQGTATEIPPLTMDVVESRVRRGDIVATATFDVRFSPDRVEVAAPRSGVVSEVLVERGAAVLEGAPLLVLSLPTEERLLLVEFEAATSALALADATNADPATRAGAAARLFEATAAAARAELLVDGAPIAVDTTLLSPAPGVVRRLEGPVGSEVLANDLLLVLDGPDGPSASGTIPAGLAEQLPDGASATVVEINDARPPTTGVLRYLEISEAATGDPDEGSDEASDTPVVIVFDEPPTYNDGVRLRVTAVAETVTDVLVVPTDLVRGTAADTFVIVRDGDRYERIDVNIGIQTASLTQITSPDLEGRLVVGP